MKKRLVILLFLIFILPIFTGCTLKCEAESYLRIHIRANSNLSVDQNVKYVIKDKVVNFLTPKIAECKNLEDVKNCVLTQKSNLENLCDQTLKNKNLNYCSNLKIANEFFPTRAYGEYVLEADFYDAIIIELGEAKGDNWWCVVYPPLCFLNAKEINCSNLKYKSKIYELIQKFFD